LIFADGRLTSLVALSSKQQFPSEVVGLHITLITARSVDTKKDKTPIDIYYLDDAQKKTTHKNKSDRHWRCAHHLNVNDLRRRDALSLLNALVKVSLSCA
jgi:hypothetical protein